MEREHFRKLGRKPPKVHPHQVYSELWMDGRWIVNHFISSADWQVSWAKKPWGQIFPNGTTQKNISLWKVRYGASISTNQHETIHLGGEHYCQCCMVYICVPSTEIFKCFYFWNPIKYCKLSLTKVLLWSVDNDWSFPNFLIDYFIWAWKILFSVICDSTLENQFHWKVHYNILIDILLLSYIYTIIP